MDPIGLEDLCRPQRDRWNRALVDARICVLDVTNVDDDSSYLLTMQGTTDIYTISVPYMTGRPMKCTCFDAKKRKDLNCKHVLKACQVFGLLTPVMDDIAIASPFEDSKLLFHLVNQEPLTLSESEIDKIHNVMRLRGLKAPSAPVAAVVRPSRLFATRTSWRSATSTNRARTPRLNRSPSATLPRVQA
jgi:hypothetical protein